MVCTYLAQQIEEDDKVPMFLKEEIEFALRKMKPSKAVGIDQLTSGIIKLGGEEAIHQIQKIFNNILKTKTIPKEWREAKVTTLHKKGDRKDIKNYRPISLISHMYKLFSRVLQKRLDTILDENQPRQQAAFRKGF